MSTVMRKGLAETASDADLDALASVGPSDVQAAALQWRLDAPERYRRLLDATPEDRNRGEPTDA